MGGGCLCFACAAECHRGHALTRIGTAECFCDCGHARATCVLMMSPAERKHLKAKSQLTPDHAVQTDAPTRAMDEEAEHPCIEIRKEVTRHTRDTTAERGAAVPVALVVIMCVLLLSCVSFALSVPISRCELV
jgi:hypothetical protein